MRKLLMDLPQLAFLVMLCQVLAPVSADNQSGDEYEFRIESRHLKGFLQFKESGLGEFYKIQVKAAKKTDKEGEGEHIEDLFFCTKVGERPAIVGCRRHKVLSVTEKMFAIKLKLSEKLPSEDESTALATALPYLIVELRAMNNRAGEVRVPGQAFEKFKQHMMNCGYVPQSQMSNAGPHISHLAVNLTSDPVGQGYEVMQYRPQKKKSDSEG